MRDPIVIVHYFTLSLEHPPITTNRFVPYSLYLFCLPHFQLISIIRPLCKHDWGENGGPWLIGIVIVIFFMVPSVNRNWPFQPIGYLHFPSVFFFYRFIYQCKLSTRRAVSRYVIFGKTQVWSGIHWAYQFNVLTLLAFVGEFHRNRAKTRT